MTYDSGRIPGASNLIEFRDFIEFL
jgi:hypothetical protein